MLRIIVPEREFYDNLTNRFYTTKETKLSLEHSLVSISKWEQKYKVPFIGHELSALEMLDYIRFMTITQNVDPLVYRALTRSNVQEIRDYMEDTMTATWFSNMPKKTASGKAVTNELIYCWMFSLNIPKECEKWHFNRLTTLIRVCSSEMSSPEKMSKSETAAYYARLNAERKKKWNTTG